MSQSEKMILFLVGLFCVAVVLASLFWRSNQYYSNAYTPIVEKARANRAIIQQNRNNEGKNGNDSSGETQQPQASGFQEQDIEKHNGDRFSTY
jgi:hypothetical protein